MLRPKMILLEVDEPLTASRVFGRTSKGRLNRDSSPRQRAEFERWLGYHRELVSLLLEDLDMTRIDADAPPAALAAQVFDALQKSSVSRVSDSD